MTSDFIRKFHIYKLVSKHSNNSFISKQQIKSKLKAIYELNFENPLYIGLTKISEKTISRDIKDIQTFFGVEINLKRNAGYYLEEESLEDKSYQKIMDKMELFLASHKEQEWGKYVTTENSSLNPVVNIFQLIRAIKEKKYIHFSYNGWYDEDHFKNFVNIKAQPLHIKEANRAWYLIVFNEKFGLKTLCLDFRIKKLQITNEKIENPYTFNVKQYFKNSINILNDNSEPVRIVLKVANHHFNYLKSKPLHHSQKVLTKPKKTKTKKLNYLDSDMWGKLEVFLQPNYEFIMEIFKFNLWVQVVEPQSFVDKIANHYHFVAVNYYPTAEPVTQLKP